MAQINQPDKPKAFCSKNGCIEKVHGNLSYCKEHAEEGRGAAFKIQNGDKILDVNPPQGYHYKAIVGSISDFPYILWERDE